MRLLQLRLTIGGDNDTVARKYYRNLLQLKGRAVTDCFGRPEEIWNKTEDKPFEFVDGVEFFIKTVDIKLFRVFYEITFLEYDAYTTINICQKEHVGSDAPLPKIDRPFFTQFH